MLSPALSAGCISPHLLPPDLADGAVIDVDAGGVGAPDDAGGGPAVLDGAVQFPNGAGSAAHVTSGGGAIDTAGPFFQSLGANDRACVTCHDPEDGWSVTTAGIQARFAATQGTDPIFRVNDGASCPDAEISTAEARRTAFSLLLNRGVIRVELPIPADAEFELVASAGRLCAETASGAVSVYRRPLPATNLKFISAVMWDGRLTSAGQSIRQDLEDQANAATLGHAQASAPLPEATRRQIVDFELGLFTAEAVSSRAQALDAAGASGGPAALATFPFAFGLNDDPHQASVFTIFDAWSGLGGDAVDDARAQIARGQEIFNHRSFSLLRPPGPNGGPPPLPGPGPGQELVQCGTCHETPNVGTNSAARFVNLGISDPPLNNGDLPIYTLRNKATGAQVQTTDPGRALISGKWADLGAFKVPSLRGLAARTPYFHNGLFHGLDDVVEFYDRRFGIGLSAQDRADLVAFLSSL